MRIYKNDQGEVVFDGEGDIVLSKTNHSVFIDSTIRYFIVTNFHFTGNRMSFWKKMKFIFRTIYYLFKRQTDGDSFGIEIGGSND